MAIVSKEQLYQWFSANNKPTQEQFYAWLDSFWHKHEKIPQLGISGLDSVLGELQPKDQLGGYLLIDGSNLTEAVRDDMRVALGVGGRNLGTRPTKAHIADFSEPMNGDFFATTQYDKVELKEAGTIWYYVESNQEWAVFSEPIQPNITIEGGDLIYADDDLFDI